jgi:ectoine hydroxylase-related dioxygenase (phytanoyl-CoA dioxygenase family)
MEAIQSVLTPEQKGKFKPVAIELKKGEAALHYPLMVHGSFENWMDRQRRATVINVFRDGIISNTNTPLLRGVPVIGKGQRVEGQFFPLLYDPERI